mmetsp:Transcript_131243/g.356342  ORF Transcript_131243/g.356342 Transcript_131243/m.356342 type:complete len:211 (-) Transcript_131243:841-1473(-)
MGSRTQRWSRTRTAGWWPRAHASATRRSTTAGRSRRTRSQQQWRGSSLRGSTRPPGPIGAPGSCRRCSSCRALSTTSRASPWARRRGPAAPEPRSRPPAGRRARTATATSTGSRPCLRTPAGSGRAPPRPPGRRATWCSCWTPRAACAPRTWRPMTRRPLAGRPRGCTRRSGARRSSPWATRRRGRWTPSRARSSARVRRSLPKPLMPTA